MASRSAPSLAVHAGKHARVGAERDSNASVPEKLLGESGEQESGAGVTQVVEAGVGETGLVQERREAALSEAGEEFMVVPVSVVKTRVLVVVEFSEGAKYAKG